MSALKNDTFFAKHQNSFIFFYRDPQTELQSQALHKSLRNALPLFLST